MTVDRLDRLAEGVGIARRSRSIAVQSVVAGMSLSIVAMAVAAAGFLPPVAGAVLQEGIDVLVVLNALRALGGPAERGIRGELLPVVDRIRQVADRLDAVPPPVARGELARLSGVLEERLLPHEAADDAAL